MPGTFEYNGLFSARSQDNPIRIAKHAKYDFAVAYPAPETLPLDGLSEALRVAIDTKGDEMAREMAYYPHALGSVELREFVSEKLATDRGFHVGPDEIMLTAGSGEAIALLIQALTNPGDTVITEEFVYAGTLNQMYRFEADVVGTPLDDQGIIPEALEDLIKKLIAEGRRPKYLYTIAEHQNPTGSTLPDSRRRQILDIAHRYNMPIMEDECYVDLRFEGKPETAFRALDDSGIVLHVASFSKLLAPGLRLGYFTATDEVMRRASSFKHGSGPNQFASYAINGFLRNNLQSHRDAFNPLLKKKRDAMDAALKTHFSGMGATWSRPSGGCYTWLTMPEGVDLAAVQPAIMDEGVGYIPGPNFAPNGNGQNSARLCFAFESPEKNREGIALLGQLLEKHGALV